MRRCSSVPHAGWAAHIAPRFHLVRDFAPPGQSGLQLTLNSSNEQKGIVRKLQSEQHQVVVELRSKEKELQVKQNDVDSHLKNLKMVENKLNQAELRLKRQVAEFYEQKKEVTCRVAEKMAKHTQRALIFAVLVVWKQHLDRKRLRESLDVATRKSAASKRWFSLTWFSSFSLRSSRDAEDLLVHVVLLSWRRLREESLRRGTSDVLKRSEATLCKFRQTLRVTCAQNTRSEKKFSMLQAFTSWATLCKFRAITVFRQALRVTCAQNTRSRKKFSMLQAFTSWTHASQKLSQDRSVVQLQGQVKALSLMQLYVRDVVHRGARRIVSKVSELHARDAFKVWRLQVALTAKQKAFDALRLRFRQTKHAWRKQVNVLVLLLLEDECKHHSILKLSVEDVVKRIEDSQRQRVSTWEHLLHEMQGLRETTQKCRGHMQDLKLDKLSTQKCRGHMQDLKLDKLSTQKCRGHMQDLKLDKLQWESQVVELDEAKEDVQALQDNQAVNFDEAFKFSMGENVDHGLHSEQFAIWEELLNKMQEDCEDDDLNPPPFRPPSAIGTLTYEHPFRKQAMEISCPLATWEELLNRMQEDCEDDDSKGKHAFQISCPVTPPRPKPEGNTFTTSPFDPETPPKVPRVAGKVDACAFEKAAAEPAEVASKPKFTQNRNFKF